MMADLRLKQIVVVLCLMASLLLGSASVCTCSHHEETKVVESDCHSHHKSEATEESSADNSLFDAGCVCFAGQSSPYVASAPESKQFKAADVASNNENVVAVPEFVAVAVFNHSTPEFANRLSYSFTLKSLLPARAPPRL